DGAHAAREGRRGVVEAISEIPDRVDAPIRRRVDLDEVQRTALADRDTRGADVTGVRGGAEVLAVDGLGDDPGKRRLARAARSREQERVRDLARRDRVAQRR